MKKNIRSAAVFHRASQVLISSALMSLALGGCSKGSGDSGTPAAPAPPPAAPPVNTQGGAPTSPVPQAANPPAPATPDAPSDPVAQPPVEATPTPAPVSSLALCKISYKGTFTHLGDAAGLAIRGRSFTLTGNGQNYAGTGTCTETSAANAIFRFSLNDDKSYVFKGTIRVDSEGNAELAASELKNGKVIDHLKLTHKTSM